MSIPEQESIADKKNLKEIVVTEVDCCPSPANGEVTHISLEVSSREICHVSI